LLQLSGSSREIINQQAHFNTRVNLGTDFSVLSRGLVKERLGVKKMKREKESLKNAEVQKVMCKYVTQLSLRHQEENDAHQESIQDIVYTEEKQPPLQRPFRMTSSFADISAPHLLGLLTPGTLRCFAVKSVQSVIQHHPHLFWPAASTTRHVSEKLGAKVEDFLSHLLRLSFEDAVLSGRSA
jgi:hypothetical protein